MELIGGKRWYKHGGTWRVYFNAWPEWIGLEIEYYKTGNVRSAAINGRLISNSAGKRLLSANPKVYWEAGCIHTNVSRAAENAGVADYGVDGKSLDDLIRDKISQLVIEAEKNQEVTDDHHSPSPGGR
jgi:hypothetical protein